MLHDAPKLLGYDEFVKHIELEYPIDVCAAIKNYILQNK